MTRLWSSKEPESPRPGLCGLCGRRIDGDGETVHRAGVAWDYHRDCARIARETATPHPEPRSAMGCATAMMADYALRE